MNNIKKLNAIYFGDVNRQTNQLTENGIRQMQELILPLEYYLKGEDASSIMMLCSPDPRAGASAKFLQDELNIPYEIDNHFLIAGSSEDYNKALAVLKRKGEEKNATTVILVTHGEFVEEFPKYVVRDSDHSFIDQIRFANDITAVRGSLVYLNFINGSCSIHYPSPSELKLKF